MCVKTRQDNNDSLKCQIEILTALLDTYRTKETIRLAKIDELIEKTQEELTSYDEEPTYDEFSMDTMDDIRFEVRWEMTNVMLSRLREIRNV